MIEKRQMSLILAIALVLNIFTPFKSVGNVFADEPEILNVQNQPGTDESWNGDLDDLETGYTKYKDEDGNEIADIRKVAKETDIPGLFDVYLNIRGKTKPDQ